MKDQDTRIRQFIEKVADIQESEKNKGLSRDELKEIAFEMGMTDQEWLVVEKTFQDHLTRGKGFLSYNNSEDALGEFTAARAIYPDDIEVLFYSALAYKSRWMSNGDKEDREKALSFAYKCLEIDPAHGDSLELVSTLKQNRRQKRVKPKNKVIIFLIATIVLVAVMFLFVQLLPTVQTVTIPLPPETREQRDVHDSPREDEKKNELDISSLAINQVLIPYITCINRHSERIYASYNRYLSWIDDPQKGPSPEDGTVYGLYDIYDSDTHLEDIREMNRQIRKQNTSQSEELYMYGYTYFKAFEALKPVLKQALEYYEFENYKDDNFQKGQVLHAPLLSAFLSYIEADTTLRSYIEELQSGARAKALESLYLKDKFSREYQVLYCASWAYQTLLDAVETDRDMQKKGLFFQSLKAYEKGLTEFSYIAETKENSWGLSGSYIRNYENLEKTFTFFRRAVRNGQTREDYRTTTIYDQIIDDFNRTVDPCNYLITSTFEPELQFLWLKYPIELLPDEH